MTNQEHNALEQEIAERRRVEDILQHRTSELALINQATQLLTSTLDLTTVLETVLSGMHNLLNITATSFWLRLPQTGELVCQHAIGLGSDTVIGWRLAEGQGLAGRAAKTGETIIVPDTDQDQRHFKLVDEVSGIRFRSVLSLPLRTRNGIIGVLNLVDTEPNRLSQEELNLLEPIAAAGAIAIENARLYQAAQDDIAERKRMEEALRRQNEELDSFAHTVAHNLKNPISTVIGYTDYIIQDFAQLDEAEIRESAEIAKEAAYKASSIISELLLLARVRKSETQREPLVMEDIIYQVQSRLQPMIEEYKAEIVMPKTWPMVLGYAPWVEEVWINYVSNGIKYGGQPPRLELGATLQSDQMVRFWVRDNGAGLTSEAQGSLFVEFSRLNKFSVPGHGLGLSIVRRIVEKLGGHVGVKSEIGRGSEFFFTLPEVDLLADVS